MKQIVSEIIDKTNSNVNNLFMVFVSFVLFSYRAMFVPIISLDFSIFPIL